MAKLPRTNEEDLLETYPPNRPHPQAGEDGAVENKVAPEHVGGAGESAPDDERRPGPDEPTWITERVQHQRARKRAVIVGAAALVVALGLIAFMLGGRSDDHSASAETERGGQPSLKALGAATKSQTARAAEPAPPIVEREMPSPAPASASTVKHEETDASSTPAPRASVSDLPPQPRVAPQTQQAAPSITRPASPTQVQGEATTAAVEPSGHPPPLPPAPLDPNVMIYR